MRSAIICLSRWVEWGLVTSNVLIRPSGQFHEKYRVLLLFLKVLS